MPHVQLPCAAAAPIWILVSSTASSCHMLNVYQTPSLAGPCWVSTCNRGVHVCQPRAVRPVRGPLLGSVCLGGCVLRVGVLPLPPRLPRPGCHGGIAEQPAQGQKSRLTACLEVS